jgi:hypothetical protein
METGTLESSQSTLGFSQHCLLGLDFVQMTDTGWSFGCRQAASAWIHMKFEGRLPIRVLFGRGKGI